MRVLVGVTNEKRMSLAITAAYLTRGRWDYQKRECATIKVMRSCFTNEDNKTKIVHQLSHRQTDKRCLRVWHLVMQGQELDRCLSCSVITTTRTKKPFRSFSPYFAKDNCFCFFCFIVTKVQSNKLRTIQKHKKYAI